MENYNLEHSECKNSSLFPFIETPTFHAKNKINQTGQVFLEGEVFVTLSIHGLQLERY